MKAAALVKRIPGNAIECFACSRRCKIQEGNAGFCGVRANDGGNFNLIVYGRPCAVWADPIEKKPLFHFLPGTKSYSIGTFGCNFACDFCQNWDISQVPHDAREKDPQEWHKYFQNLVGRCRQLSPRKAVEEAVESGCSSISFTYNEPTIFTEYALDIMDEGKDHDLKFVYVTNGYESPECWNRLKGRLHAANIDLKAYSQKFYEKLCKASIEPVKDSIETAKKYGIHVEITTLIIPGWNDSPKELTKLAEFLAGVDSEMPWHVTAFTPHYKMMSNPSTEPDTLLQAQRIGKSAGLAHVYVGNLPSSYSEHESTICPKCGKAVIERSGLKMIKYSLSDGKCSCGKKIKGIWR